MIHLICALKCEARPLIRYYHLKQLEGAETFPVYVDKTFSLSLIITGPGKTMPQPEQAIFTHYSIHGEIMAG